jgi:hypothetical protein
MRPILSVTTAVLLVFGAGVAEAADSRFAQIFMASAFPNQDGDALIPPCKVVVAQFERLEQHHQQAGMH